MPNAKLTSKGQITVPAAVRRALGVESGDYLAFEMKADYVVVRRQKGLREVVEDAQGLTKGLRRAFASDDEAVAEAVAEDAAKDLGTELFLVRSDSRVAP